MTVIVVVRAGGGIRTVYSDALRLAVLGRATIRRASHVEPDDTGFWCADLSPVGGPRLGPFELRSEALAAETTWLGERLADLPVD
jgi:hypothetical protein